MARILGVGVLRCDTSCWPGCCRRSNFEGRGSLRHRAPQQDETFGRLNPEHLVGMLGWRNPAREAVFDIEFVEEETGCRRADFGDRIDLLTDQGLHQPGRECGLLFRAVRSLSGN